jgi:predicted PurR-regulated permease PerM
MGRTNDEPANAPSPEGDDKGVPLDIRSVALTTLAVLAVLVVLRYAQPVLIPIVLGVLVGYALSPLVASLARWRIPRAIGAAVAVSMLVGGLGLGAYTLSDQALAIVAKIPAAAQRVRDRMGKARDGAFQQVQRAASEIEKTADVATQPVASQAEQLRSSKGVQRVQIVEPAFKASDYLWIGGAGLVGFVGQFSVIIFLAYFFLVTGDLYKRKLVKIAGPTFAKRRITIEILDDINRQIESFIRVQVATSALVAFATAVVLWWFGLEQYAIWGLLAGVFNSIPYLGPVVISGGLAVVAFLQFDDLLKTAYICAAALAITSLEGLLLLPALMGRAARMNPFAIFVGLLFWSWIWGFWGTILAVPLLMMCKAVCDHVEDLQPIGELLGE